MLAQPAQAAQGTAPNGYLADGPLFSAAIEALGLRVTTYGTMFGQGRRNAQRIARGARGLEPYQWLELAGMLEAGAAFADEAAWSGRKRVVARLIRERVAGADPTAVFGGGDVTPAGYAPERVIAHAPLVGTHEHATVELRPDGSYGWRIGKAGALSGRYGFAEDALVTLKELVGEGRRPRAEDADLTRMSVACLRHDNRRLRR
jgi:hypothetical protein